jgi:hypothetical protein
MSPLDAVIWVVEFLLIFGGVLVAGWLLLRLLVWLGKSIFRTTKLSARDWYFLIPVIMVLLYMVLSVLGIVPKPK